MFSADFTKDSKLSVAILESISVEAWEKTYSWTSRTVLQVKDASDRDKLEKVFPNGGISFDDRTIISQYVFWKKTAQVQTPNYMSLDKAASSGFPVAYEAEGATIFGTEERYVPASRVPMDEDHLQKTKDGPAVRAGSDVIAASVASMTRWTGKDTTFSMPVETMKKFEFVHAKPEGIQPFLSQIPPGSTTTGMKGRAWAYYLMHHLQSMETEAYLELMSNWCRAMFNLPRPGPKNKLSAVFDGNINLVCYKDKHYYRLTYQKPAALGSFNRAYEASHNYEEMAKIIIEFAAARQGDSSGISMLSQSSASWGLVSKTQSEMEQTVAVILGEANEKVVLAGYTGPEIERIRVSVAAHNPKIKVFEHVDAYRLTDTRTQSSRTEDGLFLIRLKTMMDTTVTSNRTGKVRAYPKDEALRKMWQPVEAAIRGQPNVIVLAAGLPPLDTDIHVFEAANSWASVFFFSMREELKKMRYAQPTNVIVEFKPIGIDQVYEKIVKGMNTTIASWIVPPINRLVSYSALLRPVKADKKKYVTYSPDADEFQVHYLEIEEELKAREDGEEEDEESPEQGDDPPNDQVHGGQGGQATEGVNNVPARPPPRAAPRPRTFVPEMEVVEEL